MQTNLKKGDTVLAPKGIGKIIKVYRNKKSIIDNQPLGKRYAVKYYNRSGEFSKIVYPASMIRKL